MTIHIPPNGATKVASSGKEISLFFAAFLGMDEYDDSNLLFQEGTILKYRLDVKEKKPHIRCYTYQPPHIQSRS